MGGTVNNLVRYIWTGLVFFIAAFIVGVALSFLGAGGVVAILNGGPAMILAGGILMVVLIPLYFAVQGFLVIEVAKYAGGLRGK